MRLLVTGGGGFLGKAIVRQLLDQQHQVITYQRGDYPQLREWGAETVIGNLKNRDEVIQASVGCDAIFHVAAKAGVWGDEQDYYEANVIATENVLTACDENKIEYLIYTSTPSVVFDGTDEEGIDETEPYSNHFFNVYQKTKAKAEQLVLKANSDALKTIALRPHLIWGPGDPHLVPRVIERASMGKLKLVGNGDNKVDSCYIDNAALAHIQALTALETNPNANGRAYFISNDEPIEMKRLLNQILTAANLPAVTKTVPVGLAFAVGAVLETIYRLLGRQEEPIMTRFVARQLSTHHWFDLSAAKKELNYSPAVSISKGMELLAASLNDN